MLLEERWSGSEDAFEAERPLIGSLDVMDTPAYSVAVPAGRGRTGDDVTQLLERMRADDPNEPLWRGVERIDVRTEAALVQFRTGVDPRLIKSGDVEVACHLYNEYAPLAVDDVSPP